jgi:hypothetical protein
MTMGSFSMTVKRSNGERSKRCRADQHANTQARSSAYDDTVKNANEDRTATLLNNKDIREIIMLFLLSVNIISQLEEITREQKS